MNSCNPRGSRTLPCVGAPGAAGAADSGGGAVAGFKAFEGSEFGPISGWYDLDDVSTCGARCGDRFGSVLATGILGGLTSSSDTRYLAVGTPGREALCDAANAGAGGVALFRLDTVVAGEPRGDTDVSSTDLADTDSDTLEEPCEAYTRERMSSQCAPALCRWGMSCPEDQRPSSEAECIEEARQFWRITSTWDDCLARECALWLDTNPPCNDASDAPAACNDFPNA